MKAEGSGFLMSTVGLIKPSIEYYSVCLIYPFMYYVFRAPEGQKAEISLSNRFSLSKMFP